MIAARELRVQTREELNKKLIELRLLQLQQRILLSTGQVANLASIKESRRDIARIKTVLNEMKDSE